MHPVRNKMAPWYGIAALSFCLCSCQTTNLAARNPPPTMTHDVTAAADVCQAKETSRNDCQDAGSCFWDYQSAKCIPSH